jgi:16S rRNA (guanine527-N7)-methyltransferase
MPHDVNAILNIVKEWRAIPPQAEQHLTRYAELLREWNEKFNLVASSTLPDLWTRHMLDSAQLMHFIPETTRSLADMGSGAGFPGLVLSILGAPHVHLIESTGKKAEFLRTVVAELKLSIEVHHARIETLRLKSDIVTARALKPLDQLLAYAKPIMRPESQALFLKGQNAEAELTAARKSWRFDSEIYQSLSDPSGNVLVISHINEKPIGARHAAPRRRPAGQKR